MLKDMLPAKKKQVISTSSPTKEVLRITGMSEYSNSLKALAKANNDWNLAPEQIISEGKVNRKIYRIQFTNKPVRFSEVEEKPDTTYVYIQDHIIGILNQENTDKLMQLISSSDIHDVSCVIQGGMYKIVDNACNVEIQKNGISAVIIITHKPKEAVAFPSGSKLQASSKKQSKKSGSKGTSQTSKKKKEKKKPFYKRTWIWILAAICVLGSCGKETSIPIPEETTTPATSFIQTDSTEETVSTSSTEMVLEDTTATEPTTIPTTEEYIAPTTISTTPVTEKATEVPVTEDEEIIVYLSNTGTKYHSKPNCGRMKNGTPVPLETALNRNIEACQNCH